VRAPVLLGVPDSIVGLLTASTPEALARVGGICPPLIVPRPAPWWWERLLTSLHEGRPEAVRDILDHASLLMAGD
jgi:hypothetical protein